MRKTNYALLMAGAVVLMPMQAAEAGSLLFLDFDNGGAPAPTQDGWEAFTESGDANNQSLSYPGYTGLAAGDITVTTTGVEFTRNYNNSNAAAPDFSGGLDNVYNDLILRNDGGSPLDISIGGLLAGTYTIRTHHLVSGNSGSTVTSFDLDVNDADSAAFSQNVGTFSMGKANGTDFFDPTSTAFDVNANGTDPVTLRLSVDVLGPGGTGNWMGINGLEVKAQPAPPAPLAQFDLGENASPVAEGWESVTVGLNSDNLGSITGTQNGITVEVFANTVLDARDRGDSTAADNPVINPDAVFDDVLRDWLFDNGNTEGESMTVEFTGLDANTEYTITSIHFETSGGQAAFVTNWYQDSIDPGNLLGTWDGTRGETVDEGDFVELVAMSDGTGKILLVADADTGPLRLNGFTIVPEPTSLALLGLGGLLIARRRRG